MLNFVLHHHVGEHATNPPGYPDLIDYRYTTMYTRAATTDMKERVMSVFSKNRKHITANHCHHCGDRLP